MAHEATRASAGVDSSRATARCHADMETILLWYRDDMKQGGTGAGAFWRSNRCHIGSILAEWHTHIVTVITRADSLWHGYHQGQTHFGTAITRGRLTLARLSPVTDSLWHGYHQ